MKLIGCAANILWIYNEEGSGAKFYNSSVYFPDSMTKPVTASGVTIDPGLDLGSGDVKTAKAVIELYHQRGLLTDQQAGLLYQAIGLKRYEAIEWMKRNRQLFKGKFIVPEKVAQEVMAESTLPFYWERLVSILPIIGIEHEGIKKAVHTALLDLAYNCGPGKACMIADDFVFKADWAGLATAIKNLRSCTPALAARRVREGMLIEAALKAGVKYEVKIDFVVNALPLTVIPLVFREEMYELVQMVDVPNKPEVV